MSDDEANRITAREYLTKGQQPAEGDLVLATKIFGPCTYVIARDSGGLLQWAFRAGEAGRLFRADAAHILALEKEEAKARGDAERTRDPHSDPQAGDILRGDGKIRRVIKRDGDMLICETFGRRYWMRVWNWRKWCEKSGAAVSW